MNTTRLIALLVIGLAVASTVASAMTRHEAACRLSVGNSIRRYVTSRVFRIRKCHALRMQEKLPAAIDCNDPATWVANGFSDGRAALDKDTTALLDRLDTCLPFEGTPAEIGYTSCPVPCDALAVTTFTDFAACMQCVVDSSLSTVVQDTYGTVPLPVEDAARHCQETVGTSMLLYFNARLKLQHYCQFLRDIERDTFSNVDCAALDDLSGTRYAAKAGTSRRRNGARIANRCDAVDVALMLDSCGTDAASEETCAMAAVEQCAANLFQAIFPPVPIP